MEMVTTSQYLKIQNTKYKVQEYKRDKQNTKYLWNGNGMVKEQYQHHQEYPLKVSNFDRGVGVLTCHRKICKKLTKGVWCVFGNIYDKKCQQEYICM